jgi:hypothetical protein
MRYARALFLCWVLSALAAAAPLELARHGRSAYKIVLGREASASERHAAAELQRFLEEISGARLPVVTEQGGPRLILVGNSGVARKLKLSVDPAEVGPEGFRLRTAGPHLLIAGGCRRGTLYGVYTFLEKLGCRWFTAEVSRIPKRPTVRVGALDEVQKPAFEYREPFFTEAFDGDWAARNKVNGNSMRLDERRGGKITYYPFVHSFYQLIPPEKYFKEHPEYFSLIAGKRRAERGQLCLSNRDVIRLGTEQLLRWIDEHPEATIYSVSQNDWEGWCECDNCRRIEEEEGGAHSGPVLRFVNALAAEVEKRHPDKLIDTLAYWYTEPPPLKVRPRPNVRIRLCPIGACEAHPYEQCPYNAYFMKNLRAWSRITSQLYVWHYNTNFSHYLMPFPDFDELAADIPMYRRHGVVGLFLEGAYPKGGGGENAELRSYVMARLLWDTRANAEEAVSEFLEGVYGKAAPFLRDYFELLHQQVRQPPRGLGRHLWIFGVPEFSPDFSQRARELFQKALDAAGDEAVRARVRKAALPVDYLDLVSAKEFFVQDSLYAPRDLAALKQRFDRLMADLRSFGITSIREGVDLAGDEEEFRTRIWPYSLVKLENAALRADVAHELGGRVIRILDKAAGRDWLRRPSPGERGYPAVAGLGVYLYPDWQSRNRFEIRCEPPERSASEVTLAGATANGLKVRHRVRIDDAQAVLWTETTIENASASPIEVALVWRAETDPGGDYRDVGFRFTAQDGGLLERPLLRPEEQPSGAEDYFGPKLPAGEWRLVGRDRPLPGVRFTPGQVARARLSWTAKHQPRVIFDLWSPERTLAPGERIELAAGFLLPGG